MRKVVSHSTSAGSSDSASCADGNTQCLLGDRCLYCSGTLSAYSSGCLQASHRTFFQLKHPLGTFLACRPSTTVLISSALQELWKDPHLHCWKKLLCIRNFFVVPSYHGWLKKCFQMFTLLTVCQFAYRNSETSYMFPVWKLATTWKQHTSLTRTSHVNSVRSSVFMPGLSPACRAGWSPKEATPHHIQKIACFHDTLPGATSGAIYRKLAMKRRLRKLRNWPHVVSIHIHYRSKPTFIQAKFRCSWP